MKARRAIINKTPKPIREPLARAFLPPDPTSRLCRSSPRRLKLCLKRAPGSAFLSCIKAATATGVDCVGLPIVVLQTLGRCRTILSIPRLSPRSPIRRQPRAAHFLRFCTPLPQPVPGCLIALKWQRTLAHVAIYTDTDTLIHALEKHGQVIEHGFRGMWRAASRRHLGAAGGALC